MKGWECPKCGRVWAPHVQECQGPHTGYSTGSGEVRPPIPCITCGGVYAHNPDCPVVKPKNDTASLTPGGQRIEPR